MKAVLLISGRVQGVGYRIWARRQAQRLGLTCEIKNLEDGRVEAAFEGPPKKLKEMIALCRSGPPLAKVTNIEEIPSPPYMA